MNRTRIQRFLSAAIALAIVFSACTAVGYSSLFFTAFAEQTDSGYQYIADNSKKTVQITGYTGSAHTLAIPSVIEGYTVDSIKSEAFKGKNTLLSVTIPDTVLTIGSECFSGCTLLGTVELGKRVSTIGSKAFENCAVLGTIKIPKATASIGALAFYGCKALSSINVETDNLVYASRDGVLFNRLGTTLIAYPAGRSGESYTVPDVTNVESYAFYAAKNLKTVTLSSATLSVEKGAFKDCAALTQVTLPSKLSKIEDEVFSGCKKLSALSFPATIRTIGENAFKGCVAIPALTIPEGVTTVGKGAFADCTGIASVTISKSVTALTGAAFSGCPGIKEYKVAADGAFSVDKGVLFSKDGTRLVAYPAGMDGDSYTVGEKVTTIGANAFDSCKNLKKLVIPATVKTIVEPAVQNCGSLVIHVEDKSAAKTYFEAHTNGFSALKIGAEKPGDVNADGEVDNADVILLRRYVAKWKNISIHTDAADVNKDAEVDNADVILLRRFVAGWKNVTLK